MYDLLITLDVSKSTGYDSTSEANCYSIALPLSNLTNHSISLGRIPNEWKMARVTPVPKPGKNKNMTYQGTDRPISTLPVVSKVIEKRIKKLILDYLVNYAPISPKRWGFMET